ncbi:hypothetical protein KW786_00525 [Candidatus Parcubacteria bacterium]|nr:hypothetical protein [Candidatus Parcubacteria bacterium]
MDVARFRIDWFEDEGRRYAVGTEIVHQHQLGDIEMLPGREDGINCQWNGYFGWLAQTSERWFGAQQAYATRCRLKAELAEVNGYEWTRAWREWLFRGRNPLIRIVVSGPEFNRLHGVLGLDLNPYTREESKAA